MARVDNLTKYRAKRNFDKTPEPKGAVEKNESNRYLIQKHAASHLHYDFRLELDGTLKSWAVPKGPSLDPHDKRLAMQVEDHPVSYGSFEGTIPAGEYGGGTVMLWDEGTWEPIGDPQAGLAKGKLVFKLHGKKLKGEWTLVKTFSKDKRGNSWLLIKHRDGEGQEGNNFEFLENNATSVASGRTMEMIAAAGDKVWHSNQKRPAIKPARKAVTTAAAKISSAISTMPKKTIKAKKMPDFTPPQLATFLSQPKTDVVSSKPKTESSVIRNLDKTKADVGGIKVSHPGRIIYPGTHITKEELAEYYLTVAEHIMPYIENRPLSMLRCPEGIGEECFFQRHVGFGKSPYLHEVSVTVKGESRDYLLIKDVEGLISLVQWGVIELHPWQCSADNLEKPDRIVFDLDPAPGVSWKQLIAGALEVQERMKELSLEAFLKTTGGKGLHVVIPITPSYVFPAIKSFARAVAESMAQDSPSKYIAKMNKAERTGKIFVDYLRNDVTATAVAPFSARARKGATVSTPLHWQELTATLKLDRFTIETMPERLKKMKSDPWKDFGKTKQKIAAKYLKALKIDLS